MIVLAPVGSDKQLPEGRLSERGGKCQLHESLLIAGSNQFTAEDGAELPEKPASVNGFRGERERERVLILDDIVGSAGVKKRAAESDDLRHHSSANRSIAFRDRGD